MAVASQLDPVVVILIALQAVTTDILIDYGDSHSTGLLPACGSLPLGAHTWIEPTIFSGGVNCQFPHVF